MWSLKGLLILANAVEKLKWSAFTKTIQSESTTFESNTRGLQAGYISKDLNKELSDRSAAASEMVLYLETLLKLVNILKNLLSADRERNWKGHLRAIQDIIPVFCQTGSVNYQRYCSLYLEVMWKLPEEHPSIYKEFMERKFVVKTSAGFFDCCCTWHKTGAEDWMVQEGCRWYQWSNKTERFSDWMGISIP